MAILRLGQLARNPRGAHVGAGLRCWTLVMASLVVLGVVFSGTAVAAKAPTPVYTEDFENTGNEALLLTGYQGAAAAQNETYTADSGWLRDCNGWVMTGTTPVPADTRNCSAAYWPTMRNLITSLGTLQGQATPAANHGLAAYTAACLDPTSPSYNKAVVCGGANQVQWETKTPIAVSPSHFYNFAVDAAATNCHSNHPIFKFSIVSGATEVSLPSIDGCAKGNGARTFSPSGPILIATNSVGLRLRNGQGSANGNDGAVDNIRLLDVTPTLSKAFSPTALNAGTPSTLTFTIENTTELAAKNGWSFTDNLPADLSVADPPNASTTCPSGSVTAAAGGTSIAASGNLDAGQASCAVSVNVTSPSAGTFENCAANVTTVGLEPPPCASVTFEAADLALDKSVDAEIAAAGDQLTYTLQLENKGPSAADSVLLKDTLPPGVSYVSNNAGCDTAALPLIECELGTLLSGESRTVQIVAQVQPSAAASVQTNTAAASALQPDEEPADNEDSAETAVAPFADLALTKSVSPQVASGPGETVTYTLAVENKGESQTSATLTDTLPAGLAYLADNAGCDASSLPTITCDLGTLAKGATATVEIEAEVESSAAGKVVENTASVSGSAFDPEPADNEASAPLEVEPLSDLVITKAKVGAATAKPGETITYLLTAENKGPTTESSVTVTDTLPPGLEYVADDGGCDTSALPQVKCAIGVQAEGQSKTITLQAKVLAATGTIENTASVSGTNPDPEPDNNSSTAKTTVEEVSDLTITKAASAPSVKPGEQLTYTLQIENKGPSASDPTTVTDVLPAELTYVSDDGSCDISALPQVKCDLGAMADDATATVEILAEVNPDAAGTIENTAKVEGPNHDPTPADNSSTATTTVTPLVSDLALTKSAPATAVKAGEEITYTLVAANEGPDPSPETVLIDELPPELTYVSDDAGCDTSALPRIECELGTLAEGDSRALQIVARVASTDGSPIQNKARVSGANADPDPGDNPDAAQVPVAPIAAPPAPPASPPTGSKPPKQPPRKDRGTPRLTLTKTASNKRARPGSVVAYRITVANRGDAPARGVEVCDHPPAQQRTLRTEPQAEGKDKPCWTLRRLAPGAKRTFSLTAMVDPDSDRGAQRNRATATAANVRGVRADVAAVGVKPLPDSGCLARPLGFGLPADVELLC